MSTPRRAWWQPSERQIEFPPQQTHVKWFEWAVVLGSIALIVVVLIILAVHESGPFIGPWG